MAAQKTEKKLQKKQAKKVLKARNAPATVELNILSNEPTSFKAGLLQLFYKGALMNSIAYADLLDVTTNKVRPALVGLEPNPETGLVDTYPLAFIIDREELPKLRSPDGRGGWLGAVGGSTSIN